MRKLKRRRGAGRASGADKGGAEAAGRCPAAAAEAERCDPLHLRLQAAEGVRGQRRGQQGMDALLQG